MKKLLSFLTLLLFIGSGTSQFVEPRAINKKVDRYLATIFERYEIPGAAVAVIQKGEVIHQKYYGKANLESDKPIDSNTLFKLHSLSKIFVATAIFQLIEEGKLSLGDEIGEYVEGLPKTWQKIQIKHLLTHSSGLPDMVRNQAANEEEHKGKVFEGDIEFEPGERFSYNQTNFWLLNRIITKIGRGSFEDFVINKQFNGDNNALIFAQNTKAKNRATEYFADEEGIMQEREFNVPEYMYGAAGIALTLDTFIAWDQNLDDGRFLAPETRTMMWTPFKYRNGHRFAYGWNQERINDDVYVGFSGGSIVSFRKFLAADITVIFLSNGYRQFPDVNSIAIYIAGLANPNLIDKRVVIKETLIDLYLKVSFETATAKYENLKNQNPEVDLQWTMNSIGYTLAGSNRLADALKVFKMNAKEHPKAWNVWDSLGEGYEMLGDTTNAIVNYKKSVALNPDNRHGLDKLKVLQKLD